MIPYNMKKPNTIAPALQLVESLNSTHSTLWGNSPINGGGNTIILLGGGGTVGESASTITKYFSPYTTVGSIVSPNTCSEPLFTGYQSGYGAIVSKDGNMCLILYPAGYHWNGSTYLNACGAIEVFIKNGTNWTKSQVLLPSIDQSTIRDFGFRVVLSGDTLFVTSKTTSGTSFPRYIHMFKYINSTWVELQRITTDTIVGSSATYGNYTLHCTNNTLFLSTSYTNSPTGSGRVYVYTYTDTNCSLTQTIVDPNISTQNNFGYTMSISPNGDKLLISSVSHVHIYTYTTSWTLQQSFATASPPTTYVGWFDNNTAYINTNSRDIVIYRYTTSWSIEHTLNVDAVNNVRSIITMGNNLIYSVPGSSSVGTGIHILYRNNTTWIQSANLTVSNKLIGEMMIGINNILAVSGRDINSNINSLYVTLV